MSNEYLLAKGYMREVAIADVLAEAVARMMVVWGCTEDEACSGRSQIYCETHDAYILGTSRGDRCHISQLRQALDAYHKHREGDVL